MAAIEARRWGFDAITVSMDTHLEDGGGGPGVIAEWRAKTSSPVAAIMGVHSELLRAQRRTVAGMPGEEIIARSAGPGETPALTFEWQSAGQNA